MLYSSVITSGVLVNLSSTDPIQLVRYPVGKVKVFSELCHGVHLDVDSTPLVFHYIAAPSDPSFGLVFTVSNAKYSQRMSRVLCSEPGSKLQSQCLSVDFKHLRGSIYDNGTKNEGRSGSDSIDEVNKSYHRFRQLRELLAMSPPDSIQTKAMNHKSPYEMFQQSSGTTPSLQCSSSEFVLAAEHLLFRKQNADDFSLTDLPETDKEILGRLLKIPGSRVQLRVVSNWGSCPN